MARRDEPEGAGETAPGSAGDDRAGETAPGSAGDDRAGETASGSAGDDRAGETASGSTGDDRAGETAAEIAGHDPAGPRPMSLAGVRETYADQADTMERLAPLDRLAFGRYRRRLFGSATGRVLDVACGHGVNRPYLLDGVSYVGADLSPAMLRKARGRVHPGDALVQMDAGSLAFDDDAFDTVISSLSTCTFPDPVAALDEMGRVCRPDGRVLLLEHGRSDVELVGRLQDWREEAHYEKHACRLTQEPLAVVERSSLAVLDARTALLGLVTAIEARPA